jgi:hypothetical protein
MYLHDYDFEGPIENHSVSNFGLAVSTFSGYFRVEFAFSCLQKLLHRISRE